MIIGEKRRVQDLCLCLLTEINNMIVYFFRNDNWQKEENPGSLSVPPYGDEAIRLFTFSPSPLQLSSGAILSGATGQDC